MNKAPSKSDQLRALREARANRKPNPFEDAARGRDPVAKEPEASGHNRPVMNPQGPGHRGSGRLRSGRTDQDRAPPAKVAPIAIKDRGARLREGCEAVGSKPALSQEEKRPTSPASPPLIRGRGRPKIEGKRPWEVAGLSKRTYYRRKAEERKNER